MTSMNQSWLYKNDTRKYPLVDEAQGGTSGLVDISVSLPDSLVAPGARLYVESLIVNVNMATVSIAAEGYLGANGLPTIATVTIQAPQAYRLYPLLDTVAGVFGYVILGSSCFPDRVNIAETHTADTGALLESVITRYASLAGSGFSAGGSMATGAVTFQGTGGMVAEVVPVYFDDTKTTRPALVLRLARDNATMGGPVAPCDMPAEVANRGDLVSTINGVQPDPNGTLRLEFRSAYDFKYTAPPAMLDSDGNPRFDSQGFPIYNPQAGEIWVDDLAVVHHPAPYSDVLVDATTGLPVVDDTKPLVVIQGHEGCDVVFEDRFDYRVLCSGKRKIADIAKQETPNTCSNCIAQKEFGGVGIDLTDGLPVAMAGSSIYQNKLCLYWAFSPLGTPVAGNKPLEVLVHMLEPFAKDDKGDVLPPLRVVGISAIRGTPPRFPGDLLPGEPESLVPGTLGTPVYSVYTLNRPAVAGEAYTLELPYASVIKSAPPGFPVNYPVYHSAPKVDSCVRYTRSPTSIPTEEFL